MNGSVGLEEALGVPELSSAVKHLQKVVIQLDQAGRTRNVLEMETTICRLELENSKLQESLAQAEGRADERLMRMREELQQQQVSLVELRRLEASQGQVAKQLEALEKIVNRERDEKEQAVAMCNKLRAENALLSQELSAIARSSHDKRNGSTMVMFTFHC